jgi:hypothetical protein
MVMASFDFVWTHFGFERSPDEQMEELRQANLFGPAGFVSADDGEVIEFSQDGPSRPNRNTGPWLNWVAAKWAEHGPHGDGNAHTRHVRILAQSDGGLVRWWTCKLGSGSNSFMPITPSAVDGGQFDLWPEFLQEQCVYKLPA